jgi:hypothetical protein
MSVAWVLDEDPKRLASELVEASRDRPGWLAAFAGELESQASVDQLRRFLRLWGLSQSEGSRLFGVSRQALSKWFRYGIPSDRLEMMADLGAATDLLVRYLKFDRIPAAVRRDAARLGGRSLLDLVAAGNSREALEACRSMFDYSAIQG